MGEVIDFKTRLVRENAKPPRRARKAVEHTPVAPPLPEGVVVKEGVDMVKDAVNGGEYAKPWLLYQDGTKVYPGQYGHMIISPAKGR